MRLFISLLFFLAAAAVADTSVWKISNGDRQLFIGGTLHLLSANDYPLPEEFDQAYLSADRLILETDFSQLTSPVFQQKMLGQMTYQAGKSLRDELSPGVYRALEKYCVDNELSITTLSQFKPSMVAVTLVNINLQRLAMADVGVDMFYYQQAMADGKALGKLETMEQQLNFLLNMGKGYEDDLIMRTINDMQQLASNMKEMKHAWRVGDTEKLERAALRQMRQDYPELFQDLLVERNNNWLPQIEAMLSTAETELVLVGALHLVGQHGLLSLLHDKGFRVEKF